MSPQEHGNDHQPKPKYFKLDSIQTLAIQCLQSGFNGLTPENLLWTYAYQNKFQHDEAYLICAVSKQFPESFISYDGTSVVDMETIRDPKFTFRELRADLERYVDAHRRELALKAATVLGITLPPETLGKENAPKKRLKLTELLKARPKRVS